MIFDQNPPQARDQKIWTAIAPQVGLTERLLGWAEFPWHFLQFTGKAKATKSHPFELFDEILCGILHFQDGQSGQQIRHHLGLDDPMGEKVFQKMLQPLHGQMVEGDDSYFALTSKGRDYAQLGTKFTEFDKAINLFLDQQMPEFEAADQMQKALGGQREAVTLEEDLTLEVFRYLAQDQQPAVHLPEKGFYLEEFNPETIYQITASILLLALEDFALETVRLVALHPRTLEEQKVISDWLQEEENQDRHREYLISIRNRVEIEEKPLEQSDVETLQKSPEQIEDEALAKEVEQTLKIQKSDSQQQNQVRQQHETQRKSFNTEGFEAELDYLAQHCKQEIWLISPWIKESAFRHREKQIRTLLKNGCQVYIAASQPFRPDRPHIEPEARTRIQQLERDYPNFFFAELPDFHEKIVLAQLNARDRFDYTGSFNVLSFHIGKKPKVSRENMRRLAWGKDSDEKRTYFQEHFARYHLQHLREELGKQRFDFADPGEMKAVEQVQNQLQEQALPLRKTLPPKLETEFADLFQSFYSKWEAGRSALFRREWSTLQGENADQEMVAEEKIETPKAKLEALRNNFPDLIPSAEAQALQNRWQNQLHNWKLYQFFQRLEAVSTLDKAHGKALQKELKTLVATLNQSQESQSTGEALPSKEAQIPKEIHPSAPQLSKAEIADIETQIKVKRNRYQLQAIEKELRQKKDLNPKQKASYQKRLQQLAHPDLDPEIEAVRARLDLESEPAPDRKDADR